MSAGPSDVTGDALPPSARRSLWPGRVLVAAILGLLAYLIVDTAARVSLPGEGQKLGEWIMATDLRLKLGFCLLSAALVLWPEAKRDADLARRAPLRLKAAAAIAIAAYYNLGLFHGPHFLHMWELFHYNLGSKYFPELGYDGLYAASANAQLLTMNYPLQPYIRDLRTNLLQETRVLTPHFLEVTRRFSPERWKQFTTDHFGVSPALRLADVRMDHGYNPTPAWTFVARLFDAWVPTNLLTLLYLALIDQALLAVMWIVLFRTYGSRIGCLAMTAFGLSFASRFHWNGGALLRFDWLVAVVLGVCMLRRGRNGWAGAAFAYAAMVRVFPVLFLFGIGVRAVAGFHLREDVRWVRRFAAGFAVAAILGFGGGCLVGRGFHAWPEFARNLEKHRKTWLNNNVGLANVFVYEADSYTKEVVDKRDADQWRPWARRMSALKQERRIPILLTALVLLALVAAAAWRSPPDEAAVLGIGAAYALVLLTCYYWAMLLLAPLRGKERTAGVLLLANALLFFVALRGGSHIVLYGVLSWMLGLLLLTWVLPQAARALPWGRRTRDQPPVREDGLPKKKPSSPTA